MSSIEKHISPLIKSQFPEFYKDQGAVFVAFIEEYYKWLESNESSFASYADALLAGNASYHSRNLLDYNDIDKTVDEFLVFYKEKYLKGVNLDANITKRRLIKASRDLFAAKGSERSFELFFNLLYGTNVEIYTPGRDVLKASDGKWVVPVYLELSRSSRTVSFPGKMVTGSLSGATGFVEYVITRNINGKIIDIVYLTGITGTFVTGEIISDSPIVENAPKIIGSLSGINITTGGELFTVGEIVTVTSSSGVEALARVDAVDSVTGIVRFTITSGGWGYSNTAQTDVSTKNMSVASIVNANTEITGFIRNEFVTQNLFSFSLSNVTGNLNTLTYFTNNDPMAPSVSVATSVTQNTFSDDVSNTAVIVLNQISANVFSNNVIYDKNKSVIVVDSATALSTGDTIIQRTGTSNNTTGVIDTKQSVVVLLANTSTISSNGLHVGTYIRQVGTDAHGTISVIGRENNFTYTNVGYLAVSGVVGTFDDTNDIAVYSNSSMLTVLGTFKSTAHSNGYRLNLITTNQSSNTRWSTGNTAVKIGTPTVNSNIIIASDVGGKVAGYADVSATGYLLAQSSELIGLLNVSNTFYGGKITKLYGTSSNTYANVVTVYTGQNADFNIGIISDAETVRLSPDSPNSNNDGPGSQSMKFKDMLISGANSTFGNLSSVYIFSGGTNYSNSDTVSFVGGNTGSGSFEAANATIITDNSGVILAVGLSSNTGNGIVTTPNVSINTSTGSGANLTPISSLGFLKTPQGDISYKLIDLLTFETKTIGTISTLTGINPGENYNIDPFVVVYEPSVAAYNKKDIILSYTINTGAGYILGEYVDQTFSQAGIKIVSNNITGNTAYYQPEVVYSTDGISNVATGEIFSTTTDASNTSTTVIINTTGTWQNSVNVSVLTVDSNTNFEPGNKITQSTSANGILVTSNSSTLIVKNVQGTFTSGSVASNASPTPGSATVSSSSNSSIYNLIGLSSNAHSFATNTSVYTASSRARGVVKSISGNTLFVKRVSLFTDYTVGGTLYGVTSGTSANIIGVAADESTLPVGDNAVITANVVYSEGTISDITVIDSGLGYVDYEGVNITSLDGTRAATGQANVKTQGVGSGYYSSTDGFLDDNKYIHDGEYYQSFSYEVQTNIPLEQYSDVLKQVLHIAGKKLYGKVVLAPVANLTVTSSSSITIT